MSIETERDTRLGRIAYEAYCKSRGWKSVRGEPLPQWDQQSDELKSAWCDAAYEVSLEAVNSWLASEINLG